MGDFTTEWELPEFDSVPSLAEDMVYLLPGCDSVLIRKTLQATYRDFCRRSAALRTWRQVEAEPHVRMCPVVPVLSGEIDCVTRVLFGHSRREVHDWRVAGDPPMLELPRVCERYLLDESPGVVWVQDKPNVGALPVVVDDGEHRIVRVHLWVEAVEVPHLNEERAPKAFLRRYGDAIVDGALARLFSMSNRSWTDGEQARQHGIAYANALSEARLRSNAGGPAANAGATMVLDMRSMV